MNGRSTRAHRAAAREAVERVTAIAPKVDAALGNEEITRGRVTRLEERADGLREHLERYDQRLTVLEMHERMILAWNHRSLGGRLAWLLTGK